MSVTHFQTTGKVNVGICLGDLTTVRSRVGMEETLVTFRWSGCSKLEMGVDDARRLNKLLTEALDTI